MMIRALTLAVALTVASIATAHAAPKLPHYFHGDWCVEFGTDTYHRLEPKQACAIPDGVLHIRQNSMSGHELTN
jgi:hypothetical protein